MLFILLITWRVLPFRLDLELSLNWKPLLPKVIQLPSLKVTSFFPYWQIFGITQPSSLYCPWLSTFHPILANPCFMGRKREEIKRCWRIEPINNLKGRMGSSEVHHPIIWKLYLRKNVFQLLRLLGYHAPRKLTQGFIQHLDLAINLGGDKL